MKTYTLDQVQDELIGKIGTERRDRFEYELQMDLIDYQASQTRTKFDARRIRKTNWCSEGSDFTT
jgi:hypothetical protein